VIAFLLSTAVLAQTSEVSPAPAWIRFDHLPRISARGEPFGERAEVTFDLSPFETVDEVAVFEEAAAENLRWRFVQASRTAFVTGMPGRRSLALLRTRGRNDYFVEGPFSWPASAQHRKVENIRRRTLLGEAALLPLRTPIRFFPSEAGALCETAGVGRWQCIGVPADAPGVVVARREGGRVAWAEIPSSSTERVAASSSEWGALVRLDAPEHSSDAPLAKLQKPGPAGGAVMVPDPGFEFRSLAQGLIWIAGAETPAGRVVELRWGPFVGKADAAQTVAAAESGEPVPVAVAAPTTVRGTVTDSARAPVSGAVVLLCDAGPGARSDKGARSVIADTVTDAVGRYEILGLPRGDYLLRVCAGAYGCFENRADLSGAANDFVLSPRATFIGRVMSPGGVPETGASALISPTIDEYMRAEDRVALIPLQVSADADGRFRIAAPARGRFVVEVRASRGAAARRRVEVSDFSPAIVDLGDIALSQPGAFEAIVLKCPSGELRLIGPVGGDSTLPQRIAFPIDSQQRASVQLPESGTWLLAANCGGVARGLSPSILNEVREVFGKEVTFEIEPEAPANPH
jgi:hypothetical protein